MTLGRVSDLHALLPVTFRLHTKPDLSLEFVVDTGFTGFLALPSAAVKALSLPHVRDVQASLADGTTVPMPTHRATIVWQGAELDIPVLATGDRPLLGTALLAGNALYVEFENQGIVSAKPLGGV